MNHRAVRLLLSLLIGLAALAAASIVLATPATSARAVSPAPTIPTNVPVHLALAPLPGATTPTRNALNVPLTAGVSIAFDEPISLTSVTSRTFAVYGSQSPIFTGTYGLDGLSRTVTLDPARSFFPGERVTAIVTTSTLNITGERAISATVWQFQAAVQGGTARFADSGQRLGNVVSNDVALGDLDGDSDLDAFVANSDANAVWLNDGTGVFFEAQRLGDSASRGVALGDLDGDGDLDAFTANYHAADTVWLNDGAGVFTEAQRLGNSDGAGVALGDLDRDGDLDAFVANTGWPVYQPNTVWANDGTGTFTETQQLGDSESTDVALGDLDGDGDLDAFVANSAGDDAVWMNDGAGVFTVTQRPSGWGGKGVALGDLDGDGDLDAFVANSDGFIYEPNAVWMNDGTGVFTEAQRLGSSDSTDVALGDLDGDGDLDAFVANMYDQPDVVWLNDGAGMFAEARHLGNSDSDGVALGDLDGDGDLDAFVANWWLTWPVDRPNLVWMNMDYVWYMPLARRGE